MGAATAWAVATACTACPTAACSLAATTAASRRHGGYLASSPRARRRQILAGHVCIVFHADLVRLRRVLERWTLDIDAMVGGVVFGLVPVVCLRRPFLFSFCSQK